jgi:hypothetical protein
LSTISAPISEPRSAAAVSVVKNGIAGAGAENHHLAFFEVTDRLAADIGLDHLLDVQRRLHAGVDARLAHRIGQRHGVHHRRQHAHVVGRGAIHAGGRAGQPAEDVAAADDDADLDAEIGHRLDFRHDGASIAGLMP